MSAADCIAAFRDAMHGAGLETDAPVIADGRLHRVHVEGDKAGSENGWFVLHGDGLPLALSVTGKPAHRILGARSLIER